MRRARYPQPVGLEALGARHTAQALVAHRVELHGLPEVGAGRLKAAHLARVAAFQDEVHQLVWQLVPPGAVRGSERQQGQGVWREAATAAMAP